MLKTNKETRRGEEASKGNKGWETAGGRLIEKSRMLPLGHDREDEDELMLITRSNEMN